MHSRDIAGTPSQDTGSPGGKGLQNGLEPSGVCKNMTIGPHFFLLHLNDIFIILFSTSHMLFLKQGLFSVLFLEIMLLKDKTKSEL